MSEKIESSGNIVAITKSDTTILDEMKAIWCGTAGTANLVTRADQTLTDFPLVKGLNQIKVKQVKTGGGASDLWALY
jgi:hypothetical protein